MVKVLNDNDFNDFVNGSFYSAVGFYHPNAEKKDEMLGVLNDFVASHGNVEVGSMDIAENKTAANFGINEAIGPIVVVFKQGKPFKAFKDNFSAEALSEAMAAPGKNITLQ